MMDKPTVNTTLENYAVNIMDMTAPVFAGGPFNMAGLMIQPVTQSQRQIEPASANPDETGLVLQCEDTQARAIIVFLNLKAVVRAYRRGVRGAWVRLTRKEIGGF